MPEFDFPAAIQELAEARRRCPQGSIANKGDADEQWLCAHSDHGYTGYYAPFEVLWVVCDIYSHPKVYQEHNGLIRGRALCRAANCPGWTPESDVRVACWELEKVAKQLDTLAFTVQHRNGYWEWYDPRIDGTRQAASAEEAQIRAAQAWLKEPQL